MRSTRLPQPRFGEVPRRAVVISGLAALGGCSVRLEKNAPLPGPKETTPSDVKPLHTLRDRLSTLIDATTHATQHPELAHPLAATHRQQLSQVEATLKGLGDNASASTTANSRASEPANPVNWITEENSWVSAPELTTLVSISSDSRPMALCIAATGLAAAEAAGTPAAWTSRADFPAAGAQDALVASQAAIDAGEWIASQTPADKRGTLPQTLEWLYGTRATVEAAVSAPTTSGPAPLRRYRDVTAAQKVVVVALQDLLPACAQAASSAETTAQAEGVLLVWTKTIRELDRQKAHPSSPFPGLDASH